MNINTILDRKIVKTKMAFIQDMSFPVQLRSLQDVKMASIQDMSFLVQLWLLQDVLNSLLPSSEFDEQIYEGSWA